jgi:ClpP class serine protease
MEEQVEITYQQFKSIVADGRGLDLDTVEEVARGRVWSGTSAKDVGLVDTNGGLIEAIEYASQEAKLNSSSFQLIRYEPLDSSSTFVKYEVAIKETVEQMTHPLKDEQQFLQQLSGEHMWMLSNVWKIQ